MVRHPDTAEEIDSSLSPPKHEPLPLALHCDSGLAYDRETRRSTGDVAGMLGKTAMTHKPKR